MPERVSVKAPLECGDRLALATELRGKWFRVDGGRNVRRQTALDHRQRSNEQRHPHDYVERAEEPCLYGCRKQVDAKARSGEHKHDLRPRSLHKQCLRTEEHVRRNEGGEA